jgi:hypothetical protein
MMNTRTIILTVPLAALLLAAPAGADPTNYQHYVIGERSLGMAGAYTAAVDDSMALYYNPGALPFAGSAAASASKSVYAAERRIIRDGFVPDFGPTVDAVDLDTTTDLSWPSTLTLMLSFDKKRPKKTSVRHSVGFAMLVPNQETTQFRAKHKGDGTFPEAQTYYLSESYRTVWTGVAYAFKPTPRWGFGLAGFFSNYNYSRRFDSNTFDPPYDTSTCGDLGCGDLKVAESMLRIKVNSLVFRAGALWAPTERWRVGLEVTAPSIFLKKISDGALDQTFGVSSTAEAANVHTRMYTDDYKLAVAGYDPASARLGAAYMIPDSFTVDLDVSFYFPVSYDRIKGDPVARRYAMDPSASPEWFDPGIVHQIDRRPTANANLGGEFLFKYGITLRTGVFTDLSAAPDVVASDLPQLTRVNRLGGTLSLGHKGEDHDITIGVIGTVGIGEASVFHPASTLATGELPFQPEPYQDRAIYVFIAGVQKAFVTKAEQFLKKIAD